MLENPKVFSIQQFQELDQRAENEYQIKIETLMNQAGRAVYEEVIHFCTEQGIQNPIHVLIFCGNGNNGGDGFACAQFFNYPKISAEIFCLKPKKLLKFDAFIQYEKIKKAASVTFIETEIDNTPTERIQTAIKNCSIIVDAILGTGFKGSLSGITKQVIEWINQSQKPIISIDIPSGMNADNLLTPNLTCVQATKTVTFTALKKVFLHSSSKKWTGEIVVKNIGFPTELLESI